MFRGENPLHIQCKNRNQVGNCYKCASSFPPWVPRIQRDRSQFRHHCNICFDCHAVLTASSQDKLEGWVWDFTCLCLRRADFTMATSPFDRCDTARHPKLRHFRQGIIYQWLETGGPKGLTLINPHKRGGPVSLTARVSYWFRHVERWVEGSNLVLEPMDTWHVFCVVLLFPM
jgi:hypothetical protein